MGPAMSCGWYTSDTPLVKNLIFFFFLRGYQLQIAFCLEVGPCFLLLLSSTAVLSSLNLYRSYVCDHSLWGHIDPVVSGKCCLLEIVYHFWCSESFCALFFLDIWGKKSLIKTYLGLSALKSLSSHSPNMGLCVIYYQLQEVASLMRVEWCSDLWI